MPTDSCQWFYDCTKCGAVLKPLPGDCCVFCSYGTVPCPPIQQGDSCCG
nr:GDCCVxC domain-containing (seleno)protein [Parasedimentitalea marina]